MVIWIGLILWRQEVLFLPPYEDQAVGYWSEADFLRRHHFDYVTFLWREPNFLDENPGQRAYGISLLAPFVALLQILLPTASSLLLVCHLLWWACTATTATLLAMALIPRAGPLLAWLCALALVTMPHFVVQAEILGMDVPVATAMFASALLATAGRWKSALWVSLLAFFFKATGLVMTLALWTCLWVLYLSRVPASQRRSRGPILLGLAILAIEVLLEFFFDTSIPSLVGFRWFTFFSPSMALINAPDVVALLGFVGLGAIASLERWAVRRRSAGGAAWGDWLADRQDWLLAWIVVAGFTAGVFVYIFVPRYVAPATPFLLYLVGWNLARLPGGRWLGPIAAGLMVVFHVANADGRFFPSIDEARASAIEPWPMLDRRSAAFTERSREYLQDHRSNIELCQKLQEEFVDRPIIAAEPFHSFLTMARTGYVERPLDSKRVSNATQTILLLAELRRAYRVEDASTEPVVIERRAARSLLPPRQPNDVVVYQDHLTPATIAYRWRSIDQVPGDERSILVWYVSQTRRDDLWELSRLNLFMRNDRVEFARREVQAWKKRAPTFGLLDELLTKIEKTASGEISWDGEKPTRPAPPHQ
jgi:hypothetical protein